MSFQERKDYQRFILNYLTQKNHYIERKDTDYNKDYALDIELLFQYLETTQKNELDTIKRRYPNYKDIILNKIKEKQRSDSRLETIKTGIKIDDINFYFFKSQPTTSFNTSLNKNYKKNILSVAEEVWHKDGERIDLVIFLNGFAIFTIELKLNTSRQGVEEAVDQYKTQRDKTTALFRKNQGALVSFAMDLQEVYMTTFLNGLDTSFLPFNMGKGEDINQGKGNPETQDGLDVAYMWKDILTLDSIAYIIQNYMFVEKKRDKITKEIIKRTTIFPRYHQLNCIRSIQKELQENDKHHFLIQHSAGSGKTKTIAWLAYRLANLHKNDKNLFDTVIIVNDRLIVDQQLQEAIDSLEHQDGYIKLIDNDSNSDDLRLALENNYKIVASTIQKFPYIIKNLKDISNKTFAVIIDEAHSSTAGNYMLGLQRALGDNIDEDATIKEIQSNNLGENVTFFAFTATPKNTTIEMFGTDKKPFHNYSMKQAIEEGFILNVLNNYITYKSYFNIIQKDKEDPDVNPLKAKRQIMSVIKQNPNLIEDRISICIAHYMDNIQKLYDNQAKAMIVTSSIKEAILYKIAFDKYIKEKNYPIQALVAFSGKKNIDGVEYTEAGMNGFSDLVTADKFDTNFYQFLIVANKFQTGFNQPKLTVMYVMKKLNGINAVQTLSRLNRIFPPYEKETFVLDFENNYEDIESAFSKYYTYTELDKEINPEDIYKIDEKIMDYSIINTDKVKDFYKLFTTNYNGSNFENAMILVKVAIDKIKELNEEEQVKFVKFLKQFNNFYTKIKVICGIYEKDLEEKFVYYKHIINTMYSIPDRTDIRHLITVDYQGSEKTGEIKAVDLVSDPIIKGISSGIHAIINDTNKLSIIIEMLNRALNMPESEINTQLTQYMNYLEEDADIINLSTANNSLIDFNRKFVEIAYNKLSDLYDNNPDNTFYAKLTLDTNKNLALNMIDKISSEVYNYFN